MDGLTTSCTVVGVCVSLAGRGGYATSAHCFNSSDRGLSPAPLASWCQPLAWRVSPLVGYAGCGACRIAACGNA
ncbi:hypothetical protein HanPSC8_Chr06g0257801 [Helianthus annuus]|nr:hypothetical protein HanPSC8_Chr06g0257801 [Helianthus annuus]